LEDALAGQVLRGLSLGLHYANLMVLPALLVFAIYACHARFLYFLLTALILSHLLSILLSLLSASASFSALHCCILFSFLLVLACSATYTLAIYLPLFFSHYWFMLWFTGFSYTFFSLGSAPFLHFLALTIYGSVFLTLITTT